MMIYSYDDGEDDTKARNTLAVLKPSRIAIAALRRNENTFLTAEGFLKFIFQKLEKVKSLKLLEEIKIRILSIFFTAPILFR